jgi:CBS domain-containing protein
MLVEEIMTENPQCCTPEMNVVQAAGMMKERDCGAIPVVDNLKDKTPLGIITDRDIAIRCVAAGKDPSATKVGECMSRDALTIAPEATLEEGAKTMEENQVRRLIVAKNGTCLGIVVQAQIARFAPKEVAADMLREISQPAPQFA